MLLNAAGQPVVPDQKALVERINRATAHNLETLTLLRYDIYNDFPQGLACLALITQLARRLAKVEKSLGIDTNPEVAGNAPDQHGADTSSGAKGPEGTGQEGEPHGGKDV
jgi:hypothetical protein